MLRTAQTTVRMTVLLAVAAGGAVGGLLRHALHTWAPVGDGFPWTTFTVNVVGALLLALLPTWAFVRRHALLPPALGTGLLGGFTTLSTFSEETRVLLDADRTATATAYVVGTVAAGLLAVAVADRFSSRRDRDEFRAEEGDL